MVRNRLSPSLRKNMSIRDAHYGKTQDNPQPARPPAERQRRPLAPSVGRTNNKRAGIYYCLLHTVSLGDRPRTLPRSRGAGGLGLSGSTQLDAQQGHSAPLPVISPLGNVVFCAACPAAAVCHAFANTGSSTTGVYARANCELTHVLVRSGCIRTASPQFRTQQITGDIKTPSQPHEAPAFLPTCCTTARCHKHQQLREPKKKRKKQGEKSEARGTQIQPMYLPLQPSLQTTKPCPTRCPT